MSRAWACCAPTSTSCCWPAPGPPGPRQGRWSSATCRQAARRRRRVLRCAVRRTLGSPPPAGPSVTRVAGRGRQAAPMHAGGPGPACSDGGVCMQPGPSWAGSGQGTAARQLPPTPPPTPLLQCLDGRAFDSHPTFDSTWAEWVRRTERLAVACVRAQHNPGNEQASGGPVRRSRLQAAVPARLRLVGWHTGVGCGTGGAGRGGGAGTGAGAGIVRTGGGGACAALLSTVLVPATAPPSSPPPPSPL